jgi:hypothetical protein
MLSIKNQYKQLQEGNMSQANFMRNLRMTIPHYITNVTSYKDSIKILKNKGILNEADIREKNLDVDQEELKKGIEVEKEHTDDPVKAEEIALDHLAEDPQYYTKLDKVGLEEATTDLIDIILKYVEDPNDAEKYASMSPDEWPDWLSSNMNRDPEYKNKQSHSGEPGLTGHMAKLAMDLQKGLREAKDEKSKWTNANGKSMYDQFKEIDNLNSQEVLIGIDYEMQKNHELSKKDAAKIVLKNLKKNPIYYTSTIMSGIEGYEPEYIGGKSAQPEAWQMKPYSADKVVDKKMGMQTVKGVNKVKSSANKAYKETNTIVKGVEELNFIAKKAAGIKQRFEPTSSTMKVVREGFKNNNKLNETVSFNEIKDLLTKISQENNLFIYSKETDLDGLRNAIKINKSIPKSGIIAVDSLTDTNYVFVVSKDKTLNDKVNQSINQSEEFESYSTRTDDLDNGIVLSLLTVSKKQQISETIDQMLTKERLKEAIRKELKKIKK